MAQSMRDIAGWGLLALVLSVGGFLGGYLLWRRPPEPMPLVVARTTASAPAPVAMGLVVQRAVYGALPDGPSSDVTERVAAACDGKRLAIGASNENFGDPAEGTVKQLRVDYTIDGVAKSRTVNEGETLVIDPTKAPGKLVIEKAMYGDLPNGPASDVTAKVAAASNGETLSIAASNDNFGDPAGGTVKKLRVDYMWNGKLKSKTVGENEKLTISAEGE